MSRYEGRLELTWTNKHQRLLADEDGSYEWVPPSDYRVAEVRLLHDAGAIGDVNDDSGRSRDNLLIRGDALNALTSLIELPEFAEEYVGKVKLVYLDPPFNTQQAFPQYNDALEHSIWLTMMRDRLAQVKTLLRPDGSVWVHCDDSEQAYLKVMMDEVFGRENFVATVIWEKVYSPRMDALRFSNSHDYILIYGKSALFRVQGFPQEPSESRMFTQVDEDSRRYRLRSLRKEGKNSLRTDRPNLYYGIEAPDGSIVFPMRQDGREGCWRWQRETYEQRREEVVWIERQDGYQPNLKQFQDNARMRPPETIWPHTVVGSNHEAKAELTQLFPSVTPFATPKPERLLQRILHIASNPGDIVLDCFLGSGTTAVAAHKMGRRWVGIEREAETLEAYAIPRLSKVVNGADPGGITKDVGWTGGGNFRILEVSPSMFTEVEGQIYLSSWATNGLLAEATAAQLGYDYQDSHPFCGVRGRSRLAVVDGLVNESVAKLLLDALEHDERLLVCGTALDPAVQSFLRSSRPGSNARKIPQSILAEYQQAARWNPNLSTPVIQQPRIPNLIEAVT